MAEKNKILLVEDNPNFRKMLAERLKADYTINEVGDAKGATKTLQRQPEVVILDLIIPKQQGSLPNAEVGFELLEKIKAFDPTLPVIILTGKSESFNDVKEAMRKGAGDYILKDEIRNDPERLPTALRNAIEKKRLLKKEAELAIAQKDAELGKLAGGVVHELSPLIAPLSEYIQEGDKEDSIRIVDRLKRMIGGLRSYILGTTKELESSSCQISDLIEESLLPYRQRLKQDDINLELNISDRDNELPCDRDLIMMVFSNLILNGIEAINARKDKKIGKLIITTSANKEKIEITFEDNGCGIHPEDQKIIFDPFTSSKKGIGLGLSVSKSIIEKHKGKLYLVKSKLGKGSKFVVELPV